MYYHGRRINADYHLSQRAHFCQTGPKTCEVYHMRDKTHLPRRKTRGKEMIKNTHLIVVLLCFAFVAPMALASCQAGSRELSNGDCYPNFKVHDTNPVKELVNLSTIGYIQVIMKAGGSAPDRRVFIRNKAIPNITPFDASYYPDGTEYGPQNPGWQVIDVLNDGKSTLQPWGAMKGEACLRNGKGNQKECVDFETGNGDTATIVLEGATVTSLGEPAKEESTCKKATVTTTGIHRFQWFYVMDLTVKGNNHDQITVQQVTVLDASGHQLYNQPVVAYGNTQYTFAIAVDDKHKNHNPLTVTVGNPSCRPECTGKHCEDHYPN
jgi:hypothetical protein